MAANLLTLTEANFSAEVLQSTVPVLVDFWAPWCGPCRMIAPVLDELATEYGAQLRIGKVNVDDNQQLAGTYRINGIPTLLVFKGGRIEETLIGLKSKRDIRAAVDKVIAAG